MTTRVMFLLESPFSLNLEIPPRLLVSYIKKRLFMTAVFETVLIIEIVHCGWKAIEFIIILKVEPTILLNKSCNDI